MRVRYTGQAGYSFHPIGGMAFTPVPGEVLDLDEELVASLGAEFEPVDVPAGFDPVKARKAELVEFAAGHGIEIDPSALVDDIRAAVVAALDATASADGDTPTGQEAD